MSTNIEFNRARFMRNWWAARLCRGCIFAHIGREVDHNHCDIRGATHWMDARVNGRHNHPKNIYRDTDCNYWNQGVA